MLAPDLYRGLFYLQKKYILLLKAHAMNELNKVIETYLKLETNHAILITGDWGVGKTFYFENELKTQINATPLTNNKTGNYKAVRISLFGIKNIEDIYKQIFLQVYSVSQTKLTKIASGIGKAIFTGIIGYASGGAITDPFKEGEISMEDLTNTSGLVLCFDDFERKSPELEITELIGLINSLVENGNTKVLILIAEDKILNQNKNFEEKEAYTILKEKTIGLSISFQADLSNQYKEIINSRKFSTAYFNILKQKEQYITTLFSKNSNNLRTLIFILTYFEQVYTEFDKNITLHPKLEKIKDEILERLLKFSIVIGIEYKKGELTFKERKELDNNSSLHWTNFLSTNPKLKRENKETYREAFFETYYSEERYYFFNSIYDFFTGGRQFEQKQLFDELNNLYAISNNEEIKSESLYQDIMLPKLFNLSDNEYRQKIKHILSYADKGSYSLDKYLIIFIQIATLGKDLKYNLNRLESRLIKGMKRGADSYVYDEHPFISSYEIPDPNIVPNVERIKQVAVLLNIEVQKSLNRKELENLEYNFYKNYTEFKEKILNKEFVYEHGAVFSKFNTKKFINHFKKMNNPELWDFYKIIDQRYKWYINDAKEDIPFLEHLYRHIVQQTPKLISGQILKLMAFRLLEIIQKLKNVEDVENSGKTIHVNTN